MGLPAKAGLMWIDCNEKCPDKRWQATAMARQHVMLDYLAKESHVAKPSQTGRRRYASVSDKAHFATRRHPSRKRLAAYCRNPQAAIILDRDQLIYQAAWWHHYQAYGVKQGNWISSCRHACNTNFWQLAQSDETVREIFLSFAAAKEAAVRLCSTASQDSAAPHARTYLKHRISAMQLVNKDLTGNLIIVQSNALKHR